MVNPELQQLVANLNRLAPYAWEATMRQVYINSWATLLLGLIATVSCISASAFVYKNREGDWCSDGLSYWLAQIMIWMVGFFGFIGIADGILTMMNPIYHAIKLLTPGG